MTDNQIIGGKQWSLCRSPDLFTKRHSKYSIIRNFHNNLIDFRNFDVYIE